METTERDALVPLQQWLANRRMALTEEMVQRAVDEAEAGRRQLAECREQMNEAQALLTEVTGEEARDLEQAVALAALRLAETTPEAVRAARARLVASLGLAADGAITDASLYDHAAAFVSQVLQDEEKRKPEAVFTTSPARRLRACTKCHQVRYLSPLVLSHEPHGSLGLAGWCTGTFAVEVKP